MAGGEYECILAPITDPGGEVRAVSVFARDVTERRRTEEALREANEMLRIYGRLVESSPDLIAVVDREYVYRMVNPSYTRFRLLRPEQIVGHKVAEVLGEEVFRDLVRPNLDRCFEGSLVRYDAWFDYPTLGRRFMDVNYYPLQADGRVEYAVSVIRDITERKLAEEERERVVAELDATISSIPDGVLIYDPAGSIVRMNSAAERMLGYSPAQRKLALRERVALVRVETPDGKPFPLEELPHVRALRGETVEGCGGAYPSPHRQDPVDLRQRGARLHRGRGAGGGGGRRHGHHPPSRAG